MKSILITIFILSVIFGITIVKFKYQNLQLQENILLLEKQIAIKSNALTEADKAIHLQNIEIKKYESNIKKKEEIIKSQEKIDKKYDRLLSEANNKNLSCEQILNKIQSDWNEFIYE